MNATRILMGMPITIDVVDAHVTQAALDSAFAYFEYVDQKFSTYKTDSEITHVNEKRLSLADSSDDMRLVFTLAEQTRQETDGYFDIARGGTYDPSGLVKGWSIYNAAQMLRQQGFENLYVEAGGDIQAYGSNPQGEPWRVGIRNPFNMAEIIKVLRVCNEGVATSGTYIRGLHIYNPKSRGELVTDIVSLTVIGPNIYEADRFATAAFAMGREGILFIERLRGFEAYMIDETGEATLTSGFEEYVIHDQSR